MAIQSPCRCAPLAPRIATGIRTLARLSIALAFVAGAAHGKNVDWAHGRWFDGSSFVAHSFYSVDGVLTRRRPARIDRRVNLSGKYIVPAFGDAHHHGIDGAQDLDAKIDAFVRTGIFYVKNPNVIPDLLTPAVRARINRPDSIDVAFSNGGLTASGGHPSTLHAFLAQRGVFPGLGPGEMEDRAYWFIDDARGLDEKWPRILAGKPDFIKTYLLFSEEFRQRKDKPSGFKGLDPALLPAIVERAHASSLRVTTHIETAADFRHAVDAGVDEIAHLPIPRRPFSPDLSAYVIDAQTARHAAARGIVVVATVGKAENAAMMIGGTARPDEAAAKAQAAADAAATLANQRANLATLAAAGVHIALGSDGISGERPMATSRDAAMFLHRNRIFDARTVLRLWSEETARTIFPRRRLGRLAEGYEADFLVLDADPIEDFANVDAIRMRVRHGEPLHRTSAAIASESGR